MSGVLQWIEIWFAEGETVSPLEPGCAARFHFRLDGRMVPANDDDAGARETVTRLALDIAFLRQRRAETLAGLFDETFLATYTAEELERLRHHYSRRHDGRFESFAQVVLSILERLPV